ncbi:MAG TPA: cyclic peptide export ABC transporter [Thermoanaerobaculia bacterium]|jgi:putative ATP-binding cassette transporter|nr:cyclic peptide export ABC transporter [Thermoanaerobaculia bacterium]
MSWVTDLSRLFSFLLRWTASLKSSRLLLGVFLISGILSGLSNVAFLVVINQVLSGDRTRTVLWVFIALCVLLPLSRFISGWVLLKVAARAVFDMRTRLARRILATPLRQLETLGSHRLLATLSEDVPAITNALVTAPNFVMQLFIVVGCLVYLGLLSWSVLLFVIAAMVLGLLSYQLPVRAATRYMAGSREAWDRLTKGVQAITQGVKELQLHHARRTAFFAQSYEPAAEQMAQMSVRGRSLLLAATSWGHALSFVVLGLVLFGLPALRGFDAHLLTGYALVILYMTAPLAGIVESLPLLTAANVSVQKVESLGLALHEDAGLASPLPAAPAPKEAPGLELAGVTHTYTVEGEDRAFHFGPFDLAVRPGDLLFVTGGNGSGKTTFAKLLCGLYAPESGEIRVDGRPVTDGDREAYRQLFSVVFSDCFIFDSLFGLGAGDVDAQARGYLERLRLDRVVSVRDGALSRVEVSQGQRKRLALLAAYLEDRPIYLFDEWAADQDPVFKEVFYHQILPELRARRKTVVVISHDDRYYDVGDRVIKLEEGQIVSDQVRVGGAGPARAEAALPA